MVAVFIITTKAPCAVHNHATDAAQRFRVHSVYQTSLPRAAETATFSLMPSRDERAAQPNTFGPASHRDARHRFESFITQISRKIANSDHII
jgi:hypothetical protein